MTSAQWVGWTALTLVCAAAVWRGGRPEKIGAFLIAVGWILSPFVEQRVSWYEPQLGILAVDVAAMVGFVLLAYHYSRYWPIWAAAFQAVTILTHLAFLVNPRALYRAYLFGGFSIGFLVLGALFGGVVMEGATPMLHRLPILRRNLSSRSSP